MNSLCKIRFGYFDDQGNSNIKNKNIFLFSSEKGIDQRINSVGCE